MVELLEKVPKIKKAEIISANNRENELKKALNELNLSFEFSKDKIDSSGGFIIKTDDIEIDYTIETMLKKIKEENLTDVAKILFD